MRDCYKKFWKGSLVEDMREALPQFVLKESNSRKSADQTAPSSKPVVFAWSAIERLTFSIDFRAPGKQDSFEAWFYWSERGKVGANGTPALAQPFLDSTNELHDAAVMIQTLSAPAGDKPGERVFQWDFWTPGIEVGTSAESQAAWKAAIVAEDLRVVPDEVAKHRVEAAVSKAIADIGLYAMPWFEGKLGWFLKHKFRP